MSRGSAGDTVVVKPSNNIYTVLSGVALVVVILGLVVVWARGGSLFDGLLSDRPATTGTTSSARR